MLAEVEKESDPALIFVQAGAKAAFGDIFVNGAVSHYNASDLDKSGPLAWSAYTNSGVTYDKETKSATGAFTYDYNNLAVDAEVGYKFGAYQAGINGQYITNMASDVEEKDGFLVGVKGGSQKVKTLGDFTVQYDYRQLKRDAWLDIFPDTDIMGGATGVKGHRIKAVAGLMENLNVGVAVGLGEDYAKNSDGDYETKKKNTVIKADLNVKF